MPAVYNLKYPVQFGSDLVAELEVRRPKGKDLRFAMSQKNNADGAFNLFARLTGQTPSFFDEMDGEDIQEVAKIIEVFLGNSPETGGNGSEDSPGT
ncbi:MAG: phage tail assembly protein [Planctomycetota bacterium]|nr:phage tail assembly protein [Planctomycetota bacterium]